MIDKLPEAIKVTFLIPFFNEEEAIGRLIDSFGSIWERSAKEVVFVNDGSTDNTEKIIVSRMKSFEIKFEIVQLSRNFGKDRAIMAGLSKCSPEAPLLLMDSDGQHSVEAVNSIIQKFASSEHIDIVYGTRKNRLYQKWYDKLLSRFIYFVLNIGKPKKRKIRQDVGDFFICNSQVVKALQSYHSPRPFMKGFYAYMGFHAYYHPVEIVDREAGVPKFKLMSKLRFAFDGFFSFTTWSLRLISVLGLVVFIFSTILIIISIIQYLLEGVSVSGFYTLVCLISALGGTIMLSIGILAEHFIATVRENSGVPSYIIKHVENNYETKIN